MPINLYKNFMKNGIPDAWKDSKAMQDYYSCEDKNWKVSINHKATQYGHPYLMVKPNCE